MAQRISRAKRTIKASGVPSASPAPTTGRPPCGSCCTSLYLMFNEGYASSAGSELQRADLSDEAIRLAQDGPRLLPDDPEVAGLLALMLLIDARRPARTTPTAPWSRWPTRIGRVGRAAHRRGAGAPRWRDRAAGGSVSTRSRRRSRRSTTGRHGRRHGLAPDPGPVRAARADDRQPGGDPQSRRRRRRWPTARPRAWPSSTGWRSAGRAPSARGGPRAPARDGRRTDAAIAVSARRRLGRRTCRSSATSPTQAARLRSDAAPEPG